LASIKITKEKKERADGWKTTKKCKGKAINTKKIMKFEVITPA
jgi:hypothetical protein